jgi:hypothetical protein
MLRGHFERSAQTRRGHEPTNESALGAASTRGEPRSAAINEIIDSPLTLTLNGPQAKSTGPQTYASSSRELSGIPSTASFCQLAAVQARFRKKAETLSDALPIRNVLRAVIVPGIETVANGIKQKPNRFRNRPSVHEGECGKRETSLVQTTTLETSTQTAQRWINTRMH